jgi:hypothetical protein
MISNKKFTILFLPRLVNINIIIKRIGVKVANYYQAIELVFGSEKIEVEGFPSSQIAKLVLKGSPCWHSLSALFTTSELELLFKDLYCLEIWNLLFADKISSQLLAEYLFNNALINDPPKIIIVLQRILGLSTTGIMDKDTLAFLQRTSVNELIEKLEPIFDNINKLPMITEQGPLQDRHN